MDLNQDPKGPAPRLPLKMTVKYRRSYARRNEDGTLRNISLTGAFLEMGADAILPSDKIKITFEVSGRRRAINALVIWKNPDGCGVRFVPFNNRDVQIVDDLMYFVESRRDTRKSVLDNIIKEVA